MVNNYMEIILSRLFYYTFILFLIMKNNQNLAS